MKFHFLQVLVLVGVFNSAIIFISSLSLKKSYRNTANFIGFFVLAVALSIASYSILPTLRNSYDWLCLIRFPSMYFVGALFLFFIKSIVKKGYKISSNDLMYLLPGVIEITGIIFIWIYVYFFNFEAKSDILNSQLFWVFHEGIGILLSSFFAIKGVLLFKNNPHKVIKFYKNVFYGMLSLLTLWIVYYVIELSNYPSGIASKYYYPYWITNLVFYLYVGYNVIINPKKPIENISIVEPDELENIITRLNTILESEKLYLQTDITQKILSKKLNINNQVFNEALKNKGILLSEIINNYRINHFISKLQSNQDEIHTLTSLAEDSGFKSRATFYRIFKKHMNMSPTEYKEQIIKNS
ncbi:hypothetical protein ATO12_20320 [Aquimarina atlantica]|uniref:HTH araC/xylS-type domain-containing protein n=1 Tax=Aquimarina atlantica TaxID=1317122 RepID=A0A023BU58_9FLAO|nr:helix-turn-helix domain-containing protein [Aquimarina atlantica]EZH73348.1 hypothetical protein ATO12_20320 [Aquimarina atlantica]